MTQEQTNAAFVDAVRRLERACGSLIGRNVDDAKLLDARCLIVRTLMRTLGVTHFLAGPTHEYPRWIRDELRSKIYKAFGHPTEWGSGTPLSLALRDVYLA